MLRMLLVLQYVLFTDAVSWSGREWYVGVWMSLGGVLRQEPVRVEHQRIGEVLRVSVDSTNGHQRQRSFR